MTGTVQSCTPQRDGRWLVLVKVKGFRTPVPVRSDTPVREGRSVEIEGGEVVR